MKKIYTLTLLAFSAFILTACSSQEAWLNGTWKSDKTKQTYVFEEKQSKWTILNGKEKLAEKGEVQDKKGDQFIIVDANGNRHQIKKLMKTIEYQPFTSDGISATNGESFKLKKEK
ncbi:hypothetical protein HGP05_11040 [Streptococcus sanguinis]|uniref:Lipoprotein n=1 Tax=Streptococcus sanguinis TaxID=1305 RepID=A0A7Y0YS20_STRSA|nr:hypothetical protein [Streptococcus sanguinis]